MRQRNQAKKHFYIGIFMVVIAVFAVISAIRTGINFSGMLIAVVFSFMGFLFFKTSIFEQKQWNEQKRRAWEQDQELIRLKEEEDKAFEDDDEDEDEDEDGDDLDEDGDGDEDALNEEAEALDE